MTAAHSSSNKKPNPEYQHGTTSDEDALKDGRSRSFVHENGRDDPKSEAHSKKAEGEVTNVKHGQREQ